MPAETVPETNVKETDGPNHNGDILGYAQVLTAAQDAAGQQDRLREARLAIYFYDTGGNPITPTSVVDLTGDLEVTGDGARCFFREVLLRAEDFRPKAA